ncbi:unnamed protein product, partial [Heterotrigona itama]
YKGDHVINYSQRGGINVVTEKQTRTSRLLISKALPADSGNYTCAPSTAESASVLVHVLNGGEVVNFSTNSKNARTTKFYGKYRVCRNFENISSVTLNDHKSIGTVFWNEFRRVKLENKWF